MVAWSARVTAFGSQSFSAQLSIRHVRPQRLSRRPFPDLRVGSGRGRTRSEEDQAEDGRSVSDE
eukprot:8515026-Alexandrium_andersonii.AAC.1